MGVRREGWECGGSQLELLEGCTGRHGPESPWGCSEGPREEEVGAPGRAQGAWGSRPPPHSCLPPPGPAILPSSAGGGRELSGWGPALASTVARTPRVAFVAVNNGPTGLPGMSPWGPRGRHADPAAGGCPALRPPGDPRSRFPSTSVQVGECPPRPHAPPLCFRPDGIWFGFSCVSFALQSRHVGAVPSPHPNLAAPRISCPTCTWCSPPHLRPGQGVHGHRRSGVRCGHGHGPQN